LRLLKFKTTLSSTLKKKKKKKTCQESGQVELGKSRVQGWEGPSSQTISGEKKWLEIEEEYFGEGKT